MGLVRNWGKGGVGSLLKGGEGSHLFGGGGRKEAGQTNASLKSTGRLHVKQA